MTDYKDMLEELIRANSSRLEELVHRTIKKLQDSESYDQARTVDHSKELGLSPELINILNPTVPLNGTTQHSAAVFANLLRYVDIVREKSSGFEYVSPKSKPREELPTNEEFIEKYLKDVALTTFLISQSLSRWVRLSSSWFPGSDRIIGSQSKVAEHHHTVSERLGQMFSMFDLYQQAIRKECYSFNEGDLNLPQRFLEHDSKDYLTEGPHYSDNNSYNFHQDLDEVKKDFVKLTPAFYSIFIKSFETASRCVADFKLEEALPCSIAEGTVLPLVTTLHQYLLAPEKIEGTLCDYYHKDGMRSFWSVLDTFAEKTHSLEYSQRVVEMFSGIDEQDLDTKMLFMEDLLKEEKIELSSTPEEAYQQMKKLYCDVNLRPLTKTLDATFADEKPKSSEFNPIVDSIKNTLILAEYTDADTTNSILDFIGEESKKYADQARYWNKVALTLQKSVVEISGNMMNGDDVKGFIEERINKYENVVRSKEASSSMVKDVEDILDAKTYDPFIEQVRRHTERLAKIYSAEIIDYGIVTTSSNSRRAAGKLRKSIDDHHTNLNPETREEYPIESDFSLLNFVDLYEALLSAVPEIPQCLTDEECAYFVSFVEQTPRFTVPFSINKENIVSRNAGDISGFYSVEIYVPLPPTEATAEQSYKTVKAFAKVSIDSSLREHELMMNKINTESRNPGPRLIFEYDGDRIPIQIYEHWDNNWMKQKFGDVMKLRT